METKQPRNAHTMWLKGATPSAGRSPWGSARRARASKARARCARTAAGQEAEEEEEAEAEAERRRGRARRSGAAGAEEGASARRRQAGARCGGGAAWRARSAAGATAGSASATIARATRESEGAAREWRMRWTLLAGPWRAAARAVSHGVTAHASMRRARATARQGWSRRLPFPASACAQLLASTRPSVFAAPHTDGCASAAALAHTCTPTLTRRVQAHSQRTLTPRHPPPPRRSRSPRPRPPPRRARAATLGCSPPAARPAWRPG
jgi:hypothetical protein